MRKFLLPLLLTVILLGAATPPPYMMHIILNGVRETEQKIASFHTDSIQAVTHTRGDADSLGIRAHYLKVALKSEKDTLVPIDSIQRCFYGVDIPRIYLTTDSLVDEIPSKDYYLKGTFCMQGNDEYGSVDTATLQIKGRGNSTWTLPKKPYRLKFDKKISLFGLPKSKSYNLLANQLDYSLMRNSVAFKIGQEMHTLFCPHAVPADVYLNNVYRGSYILTEKIGINSGSVDIDENTGMLFEMDIALDEDYTFTSPLFKLPVMVKDPDLKEIAGGDTIVTADSLFSIWRKDFLNMEKIVRQGNGKLIDKEIDLRSLADYLIPYLVTGNREANHPKSTYLFKSDINDQYHFGPIWDFDWSFEYYHNEPDGGVSLEYFIPGMPGADFFINILKTKEFHTVFSERWRIFKEQVYPQLEEYIDSYADRIEASALRNGELWYARPDHWGLLGSSASFRINVEILKDWLKRRMEFIENHPYYGFTTLTPEIDDGIIVTGTELK